MYHVPQLSQYQMSASTPFALEAPITCNGNASAFFLAADLPTLPQACWCFWGHSAAQQRSFCSCCKEISLFRDQLFFFFFLLEFTLVEFDLFLSFLSAANALASTVAILSARNLISKRVSLSKFTVCLLVGIPSTTSNCRIPNKVRTKFA